jgi:hypothetical protein
VVTTEHPDAWWGVSPGVHAVHYEALPVVATWLSTWNG